MTADYNGWNDAPEEEREAEDAVMALDRRKQSAAAVQLLLESVIDSVTRVAA